MFLLVSVRNVGAHPGGHQHGVSIQISINLGKTFLPISRSYTKYSSDLNLGEGLCIFTSFHFPDSGLYLLNGFDFYFDLFWMAWHWKPTYLAGNVCRSRMLMWNVLGFSVTLKQDIEQYKFPVKHIESSFRAVTCTRTIAFPDVFSS